MNASRAGDNEDEFEYQEISLYTDLDVEHIAIVHPFRASPDDDIINQAMNDWEPAPALESQSVITEQGPNAWETLSEASSLRFDSGEHASPLRGPPPSPASATSNQEDGAGHLQEHEPNRYVMEEEDLMTADLIRRARDALAAAEHLKVARIHEINHNLPEDATNPHVLEAVNSLNGGLAIPIDYNAQSPDARSEITQPEQQYDCFQELEQYLRGLNDTVNPYVLEAVNSLNGGLAIPIDYNAQSPDARTEITQPEQQYDCFQELEQYLRGLNHTVNPYVLEAVNSLNGGLAIPIDYNAQSPDARSEITQPEQQYDCFQELEQYLRELNSQTSDNQNNVPIEIDEERPNYSHPMINIDAEQVGCGAATDPSIRIKKREKFNNTEIRRKVNFSSLEDISSFSDFHNHVLGIIDEMVDVAREAVEPNDVMIFQIHGPNLSISEPIEVTSEGVALDSFLSPLEKAMQSNHEVLMSDAVDLVIQLVHAPRGGGGDRRKLSGLLHSEVVRKKLKHLYVFLNEGNNLCFALCVAKLLNPGRSHFEICRIAEQLQRDAGLRPQDEVGFADVHRFESHLNCKIVVLHRTVSKKGYSFFQTSEIPNDRTLFIFLHDKHYYGVKNIKGLLGAAYFCNYCYATYNDRRSHSCKYACGVCNDSECHKHKQKSLLQCPDCLRLCRSQYCYDKHKESKKTNENITYTLCERAYYCAQCNTMVKTSFAGQKSHKCIGQSCSLCGEKMDKLFNHQCFIEPLEKEKRSNKLIFYDLECHQATGVHVANFLCCMDFKGETWTWSGEDCVKKFFAKFRKPAYSNYMFIAHNARGYDSYLLLNYLVKEGVVPNIVAQGSKILCFTDPEFNQRFIDSLCFMPMKLSAMPKAMGFESDAKGYFPHYWNIPEHQDYVGPYPAPEFYGADSMMPKDREEFFRWYEGVKGGIFLFKKEMAKYCKNDVKILRRACLIFREEILESTQVDPFSCITIASVCMKIFRTKFLSPHTLAIPPLDHYVSGQKSFSSSSIQWLEYVAQKRKINIQHALNGGEVKFGKYAVDGYSEHKGVRRAYEFLGCFYHGCDKCFASHEHHPLTQGTTYGSLLERTKTRIQHLKHTYDLRVTSIWEHEWSEMKKTDEDVKSFLKSFDFPERLNPRDALFGGRTNALNLHYVAQPEERIDYYDFTSLYPFVNKTKTYPLGHPVVVFKDFLPIEQYFGIVRVKVLPPRGLWAPVLPYRVNGKLTFPLCRTCVLHRLSECEHSDDERALTGTWCTQEVIKAVEKGYVVQKIFEVWHFPLRSDTLFADYIKMFLKTKQESSGYPSWVKCAADEEEYLRGYEEHEGIRLDAGKITHNPAKRSVAKLALNSLWGKMCQRPDRLNTTLITQPEMFLKFIFSTSIKVRDLSFLNDDVALVQWRQADVRCMDPGVSNVFIGVFTTAYARLELYELMDKLQRRVLYTDTDSVVFVSRDGDWMPPLSDYLGGLTSELSEGDSIVEFVSGGPKTYGFRTLKGENVMKVKGLTLNYTNDKLVNLKSLTELVNEHVKNPSRSREIMTSRNMIVRDKIGFLLKNKTQQKRFRIVYDKRILLPDFRTLPYGY
ncbi:uncharacterized protein LOC143485425 isoform X1 [Brachyhypopomus gauderio]|uniref:uncharacterized protein LOC143485425 isoform X1 n=1 Tax=Brachyhypopomus gauderio TaxID=698409 RepID=UPI00404126B0